MNNNPVACYISGKGMHASQLTWHFKVEMIRYLETTGMGYDTRFRYYQSRFPQMDVSQLARLICDPVEYYDSDWTQGKPDGWESWMSVTRFMMNRDEMFREQAQLAVYCLDEAGFGSGINNLRFLQEGKPVLGFFHSQYLKGVKRGGVNVSNFMQLRQLYPELFLLYPYETLNDCIVRLKEFMLTMAVPRLTDR